MRLKQTHLVNGKLPAAEPSDAPHILVLDDGTVSSIMSLLAHGCAVEVAPGPALIEVTDEQMERAAGYSESTRWAMFISPSRSQPRDDTPPATLTVTAAGGVIEVRRD
ncbi:hypothetical protein Mlaev_00653 [Microbacterium laevaniformans]|uniref:Uncharacterized protein n=1 Tax=Microbacterium laevaniformans TaxID=36807 RepID=A0A150HHK7_9MICO|nr:hypothetical protein Mlaev_00653 [Microbacterium laevaniformans]